MVLLLYCDKMYPVPEVRSTYLVKTGLECSIGMCWLTVGLILGEPGSKFVHVLILLLSNQVENESGVSGWLGKWGKRFPCFPSWGISVSKNIHVCCCTIVITLVWWYVVILGVYYVLAEVCPQPFKIVADMHF